LPGLGDGPVIIHIKSRCMNSNAAKEVIAANSHIKKWVVGGHSLGGSMAASFIYSHPGVVQGLVLWASYPAGQINLSMYGVKVLSVSGSLDGLSTPIKIDASRKLLPLDTTFIH
jgi:pimeloyl-ACP methyl ester carboxylesterase